MRRWAESGKNGCHAARALWALSASVIIREGPIRAARSGVAARDRVEQLAAADAASTTSDAATARAEERERLRSDPIMAAWVELLDELESGGPLMREVVRDALGDDNS